MPLDHYVSQVHLKNFYCPALNGLMYAIRKSTLKRFTPRSEDICRINEGSTNAYLKETRAIEVFLKDVEPRYNTSLAKLRSGGMDQEAIASLAGFAAYVASCSPTAMRLHSGPLKAMVETEARILDKSGSIPKSPEILGEKSITELITDGTVKITIDPKFPQAMGVANILHYTSIFGNSVWEVLHNEEADNPFFTSDYPVAMEIVNTNAPINRIVPLAPDLAIRIIPDIRLSGTKPDITFAKFRSVPRRLRRAEVLKINRLVVRCAEDLVFFRDDSDWIEGFVAKNRRYWIEPVTRTLPRGSGHALVSTHRVVARPQEDWRDDMRSIAPPTI
jgi:hypothetical protein